MFLITSKFLDFILYSLLRAVVIVVPLRYNSTDELEYGTEIRTRYIPVLISTSICIVVFFISFAITIYTW